MSAGHTPGPHWVGGSIYDGYAACVVGQVAVDGAADRETRTLAQVRSLPDATLYAAAPDLLEALLEARTQLEGYEEERIGERYNDVRINAAIAKATGAA